LFLFADKRSELSSAVIFYRHFSLNSPPQEVLESSRGPVERYNHRGRVEGTVGGMFVHRPCARVKSIGSRCRRNRFPSRSTGGQQRFSVHHPRDHRAINDRYSRERNEIGALVATCALRKLPPSRRCRRHVIWNAPPRDRRFANRVQPCFHGDIPSIRTGYSPGKRFYLRSRPVCDSVILCNSATKSDAHRFL